MSILIDALSAHRVKSKRRHVLSHVVPPFYRRPLSTNIESQPPTVKQSDLATLDYSIRYNHTLPIMLLTFGLTIGLSLIQISEPTRLGMISYAVFCLKKKKNKKKTKERKIQTKKQIKKNKKKQKQA